MLIDDVVDAEENNVLSNFSLEGSARSAGIAGVAVRDEMMTGGVDAAMGLIEERKQKNKKKMQPLEKSRRLLRVWLSREARAAQFSQSSHLPRI